MYKRKGKNKKKERKCRYRNKDNSWLIIVVYIIKETRKNKKQKKGDKNRKKEKERRDGRGETAENTQFILTGKSEGKLREKKGKLEKQKKP